MIRAVVFDLDGVLIDSEDTWSEVREEIARENGGRWIPDAPERMQGLNSREWSRFMHAELGVELPAEEISAETVRRLEAIYRERLPLIGGAVDAVRRVGERLPLGLASSSNRELIDLVLQRSGLARDFAATVSSEEVKRGKPAPDVYLEAARRLEVDPGECAAVEDSANGIAAAAAAGMRTIGVRNPALPPAQAKLSADVVLDSIAELEPRLIRH